MGEGSILVPSCLFVATTFAFLLHARKTKAASDAKCETFSTVSPRGETALTPPIPYLNKFLTCLENPFDSERNIDGYIALCVAENKLVLDMMAERFMDAGTATAAFSDSSVYCYNSFLGMPVARDAVAYFLARHFLFRNRRNIKPDEALQAIRPNHIGLSSGAAPLLNSLFFILGTKSEACLIPAPYYAAFENDMGVVSGIVPVPIYQANPVNGPTEQELQTAFNEALERGNNPRFVLLTNPNNPLGTVYRPEVLRRIVTWARARQMQTIVDEIYALSTHQKETHNFQSIMRVLDNKLGNDVHMIWALSKDFGASGLRAGVLYSQNEKLMEALSTLNIFSCMSGPIQYLVSELLTDDAFVNRFLEESRIRILHSYQICTSKLKEMVVPYVPAEAGLFVYVDFSSLLPQPTFEFESRLCDLMYDQARIVFTPGASQRDPKPGMFRICYAWVSPDVLAVAMERLSKLVFKIRRSDWDDLNERTLRGIL